jgi:hypothetical protein
MITPLSLTICPLICTDVDREKGSRRVERRRGDGQVNGFQSFQPFRASWQNGRQTVHSVSSTPSKIPYSGFSPVRLQTICRGATFVHAPGAAYQLYPAVLSPLRFPNLLCPSFCSCRLPYPGEAASSLLNGKAFAHYAEARPSRSRTLRNHADM